MAGLQRQEIHRRSRRAELATGKENLEPTTKQRQEERGGETVVHIWKASSVHGCATPPVGNNTSLPVMLRQVRVGRTAQFFMICRLLALHRTPEHSFNFTAKQGRSR